PILANEALLDRIKFEFAGDLLAESFAIGIGVIRVCVGEEFICEEMVAAIPGDCANRLVDAQKTTIGVDFGNTDGRMFVSRGESLFLLEREQARPFERSGCPLALRNVEKAVNRADDFPSCVAQRIDVDGDSQAGAVGMLHDALDVSYRRAAIQNLGNHRTRDGCSVELEETNALSEFF